jgi:O-succinylbenzoic acid--CoA ligase
MWHKNFKINGLDFKNAQAVVETGGTAESVYFYDQVIKQAQKLMDEFAVIEVQTSGSTGSPKIISLDREEMLASADLTLAHFNLAPFSKVLLCLPITAISGLMMLVRAMRGGLDLYVAKPDSNPLSNFQHQKEGFFDLVALTPYQFAHSKDQLNLANAVLVGGAPLLKDHITSIPEHFNGQVVESYGMTETFSHVALRRRHPSYESVFSAIGEVHFSLGEESNLIIHAPHLKQSPFITTDLVELKSETAFRFLGRTVNAINSGGIKFFAEQIEGKIQPFLKENFFITGLPHETLGEYVALIFEGQNPKRIEELKKLLDQLNWMAYEKPKKIWEIKHFVYTATQKIDRLSTLSLLNLQDT